MIKITNANQKQHSEWCTCCQSDDNTKRIKFSSDENEGSSTSVVLCGKCREQLIALLQESL